MEQRNIAAINATKHGLSKTKLYKTFHQMKQRCYNPKNPSYPNYGGRGIKICNEWLEDVSLFAAWAYGNGWSEEKTREEQTIDRIDVNGDYYPENCRLIPMGEQFFNRTDTHYITIGGETKTIKEWSDITGIPIQTISSRFSRGDLSLDEVFSKEKLKRKDRRDDLSIK